MSPWCLNKNKSAALYYRETPVTMHKCKQMNSVKTITPAVK